MTDEEISIACAKALGLIIDEGLHSTGGCIIKAEDRYYEFNPLKYGNHTVKLVEYFRPNINPVNEGWYVFLSPDLPIWDKDFKRAMCLAVVQRSKK